MMKYRLKKKLERWAVIAVLMLIFIMLSANANPSFNEQSSTVNKEMAEPDVEEKIIVKHASNDGKDTENKLESILDKEDTTDKSNSDADKVETVYGKANANGEIEKVTSEVVLKHDDSDKIEDISSLKNIKNTQGDEVFTQDGQVILWENHGEDIHYEGTSDEEIPVKVKVTYYLDGKEISPHDLAGKSGQVKIRFDYENLLSQTVNVNGKEKTVSVPFLALSAMFLSSDKFTNIEVSNGKMISMDSQNIVLGYAMPGLEKSLGINSFELTEEIEIPDYVEIVADTTDFELDFTATVITNGLFKEIDETHLEDVNDLIDSMDKLSDASGKLVDGTTKLSDGARQMWDYLNQYFSGVTAIDQGAVALKNGIGTMNEQKEALNNGAQSLSDGLELLDNALAKMDVSGEDMDISPAVVALQALITDAKTLEDALISLGITMETVETIQVKIGEWQQAIQAEYQSIDDLINQIDLEQVESDATNQAREQARNALSQALSDSELSDEEKEVLIQNVVDKIDISSVTQQAQSQLTEIQKALDMPDISLPELSMNMQTIADVIMDMQEQMSILGGYAQNMTGLLEQLEGVEPSLAQLKESVAQLATGSRQLSDGILTLTDGIGQLYDGAVTLSNGTTQLAASGTSINDGFSSLVDATKDLSDGMKTFDKDGIQEITKLAGEDLDNILNNIRALKKVDSNYRQFSGISEGKTGNVRFIIETAEISK